MSSASFAPFRVNDLLKMCCSSPGHKLLMLRYCDFWLSVVHILPCEHNSGYIFQAIKNSLT